MGKYIHYFGTEAEFNEERTNNYIEPWVSYTEGGDVVYNKPDESNGHEYVDLGLPSHTVWATMNIGANSPEEAGGYYSWGETQTKSTYSWSTYAFGAASPFTKYDLDGITELDREDDVASVLMGGGWHMPSVSQLQELLDNTTTTVSEYNGTSGVTFTSKIDSSKSIFVPYAGQRSGNKLYGFGTGFNLLSSSLVESDSRLIYNLTGSLVINNTNGRSNGYTVRGVIGYIHES
jgi:hypothetical protein